MGIIALGRQSQQIEKEKMKRHVLIKRIKIKLTEIQF